MNDRRPLTYVPRALPSLGPSTQPTWNRLPSPHPFNQAPAQGGSGFPPGGGDTTPPDLVFSAYTGKKGNKNALQFNFKNLVIRTQKSEWFLPVGSQGFPKTLPGTEAVCPPSPGTDRITSSSTTRHWALVIFTSSWTFSASPFPFTEEELGAQRGHDLPRTPERVSGHWGHAPFSLSRSVFLPHSPQPPSSPSLVQSLFDSCPPARGPGPSSAPSSSPSPTSGPEIGVDRLEDTS